jgi:hypothetical protein
MNMNSQNFYPVFEADQVLTNNHLNDLFNYLEQNDRLTRIKLIGCGIVCGLEIAYKENSSINVSKGCGVTSQGYMITLCDKVYKYFRQYTPPSKPDDLHLLIQCDEKESLGREKLPFYDGYGDAVKQLMTQEEFDKLMIDEQANAVAIDQTSKLFLDKYSVVLFQDAEELSLKNCDTNDCNDKGSRMEFEVRALLVDRKLLISLNEDPDASNKSFQSLKLKRYNVPVRDLKSADDVLNAFVRLVDNSDGLISHLSDNLRLCFERYKDILDEGDSNPFPSNLTDIFNKMLRDLLKINPTLVQYFYDFIDDLIKAFYEFRHKVSDSVGECCGNEMKFPFHLSLGKATSDTRSNVRSATRQYFIYSPLFDSKNEKLYEIRSLFTRMKLMVREFLLQGNSFEDFINQSGKVKITPSQSGQMNLSERSIPYYYNVKDDGNDLYEVWNHEKAKRGNERYNLGYNAFRYSSLDSVLHPLEYDIERFNFFRIEGHIDRPVSEVMTEVKSIQKKMNLPFDVVALSADFIGTLIRGEEPVCVIQDLESDYRVLIAEFICRMHDAFCNVAHLKYEKEKSFLFISPVVGAMEMLRAEAAAIPDKAEDEVPDRSDLLLFNVDHRAISTIVEKFQAIKNYQKGATLKELCNPLPGTIGGYYLANVKDVFVNPVTFRIETDHQKLYHLLFQFTDEIETLLSTLLNNELSELNVLDVKSQYQKINDTINSIHRFINELSGSFFNIFSNSKLNVFENLLLNLFVKNIQLLNQSCFIEQLIALKNEYDRRVAKYRLEKNFNYYFQNHGGIAHYGGTSVGGTFIVVYHEVRKGRFVNPGAAFLNPQLRTLMTTSFQSLLDPDIELSDLEAKTKQLQAATMWHDPELNVRFREIMTEYMDECKLDEEKKIKIRTIINEPPPRPHYNLKDGHVIADFFIPYLCCSDCPPIAYILPELKEETFNPSLEISPLSVCSNSEEKITLRVKPLTGGTFFVDGVITAMQFNAVENVYQFAKPAGGWKPFKFEYRIGTEVSDSRTLVINPIPVAKINSSPEKVAKVGQEIIFKISDSVGIVATTEFEWSVNGKIIQNNNADPAILIYTVQPEDLNGITVVVKISNGKCASETEPIAIKIQGDIVRETITLCKIIKEFPLEPPNSGTIIFHSNSGIFMNEQKLTVSPSATTLTTTNKFIVTYSVDATEKEITIIVVVPDANFDMEVKMLNIKIVNIRLTPANFISDSNWTISSANSQFPPSDSLIYETQLSINDFRALGFLTIAHEVNSKIGKCAAKRVLTGFKVSPILEKISSRAGVFKLNVKKDQ